VFGEPQVGIAGVTRQQQFFSAGHGMSFLCCGSGTLVCGGALGVFGQKNGHGLLVRGLS